MNSGIAKEILHDFEELVNEDKANLLSWFEAQYGEQIKFSLDALSEMELKDLKGIKSLIGGFILTRNYTPNIRDAYKGLNIEELPSKISFGIINDSNI